MPCNRAALRHVLRERFADFLAAMPPFRGKGRITQIVDRRLTNHADPSSYFATADVNGARLVLDLRQFGERFLFYYRQYEPEYVSTLRGLYRRGNFLDIGSNVGIYTISLADKVRAANGRIFSVEAVPENLARQKQNVELNGCADIVEFACVALGAEAGEIRMTGDFSSSNVNAVVADGGSRSFPLIPLDQLSAERGWSDVTLLKIDVEGYEPAVFQGGTELLRRDRPAILAEFNRERMSMNGFAMADSWEMLRALGYRCYALVDGQLQELPEPGDRENLFFMTEVSSPRPSGERTG